MKALEDEQISQATISNIENGDPNVSKEKVICLMQKLGVSPEQLPEIIAEQKEKEERLSSRLFLIEANIDSIHPNQSLAKLKSINIDTQPFKSTLYLLKGKCYFEKKDWNKAEKHFIKAIRLMDQVPDLKTYNIQAVSFNELGRVAFYRNDLKQALKYTQQGIDSFVHDGERKYYVHILMTNKVIYLLYLDRLEEARRAMDELWAQIDQVKDPATLLRIYGRKAVILKDLKMYEEAVKIAKEGIEIARLGGLSDHKFDLLMILGNTYFQLKDLEQAKNCYLSALELEDVIKKEYWFVSTYTQLGLVYLKEKEFELSQKTIEKALEIGERSKNVLRYLKSLIAMGECYLNQKLFSKAIDSFEKALKLAQSHTLKTKERTILIQLTYCCRQVGDQEKIS